jgi:hypothetical protein
MIQLCRTSEKRKCPCKGCTKRYSGCHGQCKDYKDWKKLRDEDLAKQRKQYEDELKWHEIEAERRRKFKNPGRRKP